MQFTLTIVRRMGISGARPLLLASRSSVRRAFVVLRMANIAGSWLLARGVPIRDNHGKIDRWYGILTDIEARKRAEEQRERLEADLAHMNRVSMMGELSASIAHEINQPLSGIVSNGSACLRWLAGKGLIWTKCEKLSTTSFATEARR